MKTCTAIVLTIALALIARTASGQWIETWDSIAVDTDVAAAGGDWGGGTVNGSIARDEQSISPNNSIAGNPSGGGNAARAAMFRAATTNTLEFSWQTTDHGVDYNSNVNLAMMPGQNFDATWGTLTGDLVGFFGENRAGGQVFASSVGAGPPFVTWDISTGIVANTWYDMKIELLPGEMTLWSYKESSSETWIENPAGAVFTPVGFTFNYVGISSFTQGAEVYVDDVIVGTPVPPVTIVVPSTNVVVDDTLGATFDSESNTAYRLQSTPDLAAPNFTDTGAIAIGDGTTMTLFDPAGTSTSKNYRVAPEGNSF
jgi:hypothetical protein